MSVEGVGVKEVLRRVFGAGLDPFSTFGRIVARPDGFGPLLCMLLLVFAFSLQNATLLSKVFIYAARGNPVTPFVEQFDNTIRITAVNVTSSLRRVGPPSEEHFAALNVLSLGFGIASWFCWSLGVWVALKIVEGPPASSTLLSGYILSVKFYEYLTKAIIQAWYLKDLSRIEIILQLDALTLNRILSMASLGLASMRELQTALLAHTAFFTVWSIVVTSAAVSRGYTPLRKAVVGGITAFLISSAAQAIAYNLLLMVL
ncbi:MAG: hypothetical protein QXZ31_08745 [Thermofilaceae archaeon]